MNEKQMVEMQKHIDVLNRENEYIIYSNKDLRKELYKKSKQFRITIGSFIIVLTFLGLWIYALYVEQGKLKLASETVYQDNKVLLGLLEDQGQQIQLLKDKGWSDKKIDEFVGQGCLQYIEVW